MEADTGELRYVDLALDVWTHPNGEFVVLDQDEFDDLKGTARRGAPTRPNKGRNALFALVEWRARAGPLFSGMPFSANSCARWLLATFLGSGVAAASDRRRALTLDGAVYAALIGGITFFGQGGRVQPQVRY